MSKASKGRAAGGRSAGPKAAAREYRTPEEAMLLAGLTAFHTHHQTTYKARWLTSLYPAMLLQHPSVAVLNRHLGARSLASIREKLTERGARKWNRGNQGEVECWRFEDDAGSIAAAADAAADALAEMSLSGPASEELDHDEQPLCTRFLPPTPLDINVSPLLPYYLMDAASVLAVDALTVGAHHAVLDLCAAPGGKSIVIAQSLDLLDQDLPAQTPATASNADTLAFTQPLATLHANEPQASRRIRLQTVLSEYLPASVRKNRTRVEVTGWDATKIALPVARYDRVLVDAPCSSDRHVLSNSKELASWSTKRIHSNAERQELLLANAIKSVKVGGIVVYATCSLSRRENDTIIANVLEKLQKNKRNASSSSAQRINIQVLKIRLTGTAPTAAASASATASVLANEDDDVLYLPMGEATKYGWMVLPDQVLQTIPTGAAASSSDAAAAATPAPAVGHGFGPLYFCRLKRISNAAAGEEEDDEESDEYSTSESEEEEKE